MELARCVTLRSPTMYLGIDIAKADFTASALRTPHDLVFYGKTFSNAPDGFRDCLRAMRDHALTPEQCAVILEATGVYGERLCAFFHDQGFAVYVEPPRHIRRAFRLKRKTDKVDSRMIAEYGYRFPDVLHPWTPTPAVIDRLHTLLSIREMLQKQGVMNKNARKALTHKTHRHDALLDLHDECVEFSSDAITRIDKAIKDALREDLRIAQTANTIQQIKGVGLLLAAHIVCVTRGFTQHLDAKELEAYIGIAPYEYESGASVYRRPRSDGQGPAALRKVLHLAAQSLAYHHADFRAYYQRKALEGKPHNLILNNISSKLLKIIVAVIKRGSYYEKYQGVNPDILKKP